VLTSGKDEFLSLRSDMAVAKFAVWLDTGGDNQAARPRRGLAEMNTML